MEGVPGKAMGRGDYKITAQRHNGVTAQGEEGEMGRRGEGEMRLRRS